ncbi:unnamed protein product [Camellia sinensis]
MKTKVKSGLKNKQRGWVLLNCFTRFFTIFLVIKGTTIVSGVDAAESLAPVNPKTARRIDKTAESWRFSVETNDAGIWTQVPSRCQDYVHDYITGVRYRSDSEMVAKTVEFAGNGKDAWVFDIDETLLSNLPYYAHHGFGSETFDEVSFDEWVDLAEAPALLASLKLYKELQEMGFTIFLLIQVSRPLCTNRRGEREHLVTDPLEARVVSVGFIEGGGFEEISRYV